MRKSSDCLPTMADEARLLRELADAADRPGLGEQLRQISRGYEEACAVIKRLKQHSVVWCHEDALPDLPDDLFAAAYNASRLIDGVRMYPYVQIGEVLHLAVIADD